MDRVNVGFAALTMNKVLGLTAEMFGFGAGVFFLGYFIFEVPSNLILEKVGARRWIARIMISWGIISAAFAFVPEISAIFQDAGVSFLDKARTFYLLRFIFGAAEAGFFPGIILFLTYWFTAQERGRCVGVFMAAVPITLVIGGPISGLISRHVRRRPGVQRLAVAFHRRGSTGHFGGVFGAELPDRQARTSCLA